jgi:hypothetical protein
VRLFFIILFLSSISAFGEGQISYSTSGATASIIRDYATCSTAGWYTTIIMCWSGTGCTSQAVGKTCSNDIWSGVTSDTGANWLQISQSGTGIVCQAGSTGIGKGRLACGTKTLDGPFSASTYDSYLVSWPSACASTLNTAISNVCDVGISAQIPYIVTQSPTSPNNLTSQGYTSNICGTTACPSPSPSPSDFLIFHRP